MESLLFYLLKSAALVSIFLLVYQLLLRNDTSFQANRHFLLLGILAAAVLPAVEFTRTVEIPMRVSETAFPVTNQTSGLPAASIEINWWEVTAALYAVITVALLVRFLFQLLSLYRIIRGGSMTREDRFRIIRTSQRVSPFSFFHYIVLNPELHAEEDLRNILKHEKTHASQWHSADVLLANLTTALLWFNPLSWWYRKTLVQNLEYIADRETVAAVPKKEYQHTLVKLAVSESQPMLANNFYQSLIKKRILMLNKKPTQHRSFWKFGTIVPLLFAFMFAFNVKTEAQVIQRTGEITEISAVIGPDTTDEELESLKRFFAGEDIELRFEKLKRSSKGKITNLEAHFINREIAGEEGYFKVNDANAIKSFAIVSKDGLTAFNDNPEEVVPVNNKDIFYDIGKQPLFIINGKQYTSNDLEGKIVHLQSLPSVLKGAAAKEYGTKGKDGVIVVSAGEITTLRELFKKIKNGSGEYIWITEDSKPSYVTFKKETGSTGTSKGTSEEPAKVSPDYLFEAKDINASLSPTKSAQINVKPNGNPIHVVNGKVMPENFKIQSIQDEEIASLIILKDSSAEALYGTEAGKRGVVVIATKVHAKENRDKRESSENGVKITETGKDSYSMEFYGESEMEFTDEEVVYIINGKVMDEGFDPRTINPDDVELVNVLKGEMATSKYGKKGKKGVVEIRTKE